MNSRRNFRRGLDLMIFPKLKLNKNIIIIKLELETSLKLFLTLLPITWHYIW